MTQFCMFTSAKRQKISPKMVRTKNASQIWNTQSRKAKMFKIACKPPNNALTLPPKMRQNHVCRKTKNIYSKNVQKMQLNLFKKRIWSKKMSPKRVSCLPQKRKNIQPKMFKNACKLQNCSKNAFGSKKNVPKTSIIFTPKAENIQPKNVQKMQLKFSQKMYKKHVAQKRKIYSQKWSKNV